MYKTLHAAEPFLRTPHTANMYYARAMRPRGSILANAVIRRQLNTFHLYLDSLVNFDRMSPRWGFQI